MSSYEKQKEILRTLAKQVAEISVLPVQDKTFKHGLKIYNRHLSKRGNYAV
jgi:hypothetical protein